MSDFKLIAIRPRKGCNSNFLKVLKEDTIYKLYNDYFFKTEYENESGEVLSINRRSTIPENFFQIQCGGKEISVNISAIVGENGSGKSTIVELLYVALFNISHFVGLFPTKDDSGKLVKPVKDILEEVYFQKDNSYYKLSLKKNAIELFVQQIKEHEFTKVTGWENPTSFVLKDLFYSIIINYSHYALNSLEIENWINWLFHKNDGYQSPIVLNPMRIEGIIDINSEKRLLTRRMLANILEPVKEGKEKESLRDLVGGVIAKDIQLTYVKNPKSNLEETKKPSDIKLLLKAIEKHFGFRIAPDDLDNSFFTNLLVNYIYEKLKKISRQYRPYRKYNNGDTIKYINAYIKRIRKSDSHIIFKVKGAILYLKYFDLIFNGTRPNLQKPFIVNIEDLSNIIVEIDGKEEFWVNTFMMAPPSFLRADIIPEGDFRVESFSSGEKQRIHSISSIVYHIINLNSVEQLSEEKQEEYIHYNNINIILDEIELYYHPDWQRRYIADLLDYLSKINPKNIERIDGINILFLTHSPYILSDIPNANILRLIKGVPQVVRASEQTFGANIHDLLANEFFMKDNFIGEFARKKIQSMITLIETSKTLTINAKRQLRKNINLIGEPFLKEQILNMFFEKFPGELDKQKQIDALQLKLKKLKNA